MKPLSELTMDDPEVWLPVPGWEGLYEVSSHGRVRSLDRTITDRQGRTRTFPGRVLKTFARDTTGNGRYVVPAVSMIERTEGRNKMARVASLVALAFHGEPPEGKTHVLHNGMGQDVNCPKNIRWGDHAENMADTRGMKKRSFKRQRPLILAMIAEGKSCLQIAKEIGCSRQAVTNARAAQRRKEAADAA